jgi:hypothetical protein
MEKVTMDRKEVLDRAAECVLRDRNTQYGSPEDLFTEIAGLWSLFIGQEIKPHDVALMLALLKIARLMHNPTHADSWVDLAGYAACGSEVSELNPPRAVDSK